MQSAEYRDWETKGRLIFGVLLVLVSCQYALAGYEDSGWTTFTQPDGASFVGRGWGDEFEFQWETQNGYRFIMNYTTGFWCYATLNAKGDYMPSASIVGKHNPGVAGISKHLPRSPAYREAIRKKREKFDKILENLRNQRRGINGMGKKGGAGIQAVANIQIDAILVEFADVKHNPSYTLTDFNNMMTSAGSYFGQGADTPHPQDKPVYGSIRDYWHDMSNGQVNFTGGVWNASGGVINWIVLDHKKAEYHNKTYNFFSEVLAKSGYPYKPGANHLRVIIYAGNQYLGGELHPSSGGYGVYEYIDSEEFGRPLGVELGDGQFFNNIGTACHEIGHAAFGFPDRYFRDYNTLQWDLMGIGNKNGEANELACPATLNPFDRASEGWISLQSFSGAEAARPFTYRYSAPQILQVAVSGNEYYLVENRRNRNGGGGTFDKFLPAQGILVWHVTDTTGLGIIDLIEADNIQDEFTQSGDPFPGSANNTCLNDFTTPNCRYTTGTNSHMVLHHVSAPATTMTASFGSKWFGTTPIDLTWSDTVWVGGNFTVPAGKTLTCSLGTTVKFDSGASLTINGRLVANSTSPTQRITFTSALATPGFWNGIMINSGSSGNASVLRRCDIRYARDGVTIIYAGTNNEVTIDQCKILDNSRNGLYVAGNGAGAVVHPAISNSSISDNGVDGIYLTNYAKPAITGNRIENNGYAGIEGTSNNSATVAYNYIAGNRFFGVRFLFSSLAFFHRNTIKSNYGHGVVCASNSNITAHGSGTAEGRNEIAGNFGAGLYASNCSPNFGRDYANQYGNNWIHDNAGYEAQQVGAGEYRVPAQPCYWNGQESDVSGYVITTPALNSKPEPVGWGRSSEHDPSYSVWRRDDPDRQDGIIAAQAGVEKLEASFGAAVEPRPGAKNLVSPNLTAELQREIDAGRNTGDWSQAGELITALHRELQDGRVPAVDFALLHDYANDLTVASFIRKMLALVLMENELAGNNMGMALTKLADFGQSNVVHAAELLANSGLIYLYWLNDLPAAQSVLAQLKTMAQNGNAGVAENLSSFEKILQDYQQHHAPTDGSITPVAEPTAAPTPSASMELAPNYPNPFNPVTTIRFRLREHQSVRLLIYNLAGHRVRTLLDGELSAGERAISWDGRDQQGMSVVSGVYFYELLAGNQVERRRMTLIR